MSMRSPISTPAEDGFTFSPTQREFLQAAKVWWQEGERSLDYLAEKARQETLLGQLRPHFTALRAANHPVSTLLVPILKLARKVTANRALNRNRQTDIFAAALRDLLFGSDTLPQRLDRFLEAQHIGPQTASHLLYAAFPDQFPLVNLSLVFVYGCIIPALHRL